MFARYRFYSSPTSTIPEDALIASSRADAVAQVKKIDTSATITSVNQVRGNTVTPGFWDVMVTTA